MIPRDLCDLKIKQFYITLANIYAPNDDNPGFFELFLNNYRLVLDINKDKKGGFATTHQKSVKVIKDFANELDLTFGGHKISKNENTHGGEEFLKSIAG